MCAKIKSFFQEELRYPPVDHSYELYLESLYLKDQEDREDLENRANIEETERIFKLTGTYPI